MIASFGTFKEKDFYLAYPWGKSRHYASGHRAIARNGALLSNQSVQSYLGESYSKEGNGGFKRMAVPLSLLLNDVHKPKDLSVITICSLLPGAVD
jgi:hypothetical protein